MRVFQPNGKISEVEPNSLVSIFLKSFKFFTRYNLQKETHSFNSCAKESKGDNVPDVKIIERTSIRENSCMEIPGLKHHQLSVLDGLPAQSK